MHSGNLLQAKDYKYVGLQKQAGGGIVIRDVEAEAAVAAAAARAAAAAASGKGKGKVGEPAEGVRQMEADEDFARQLQAKMDAEARGGGK